jgi:hypothetical protein
MNTLKSAFGPLPFMHIEVDGEVIVSVDRREAGKSYWDGRLRVKR